MSKARSLIYDYFELDKGDEAAVFTFCGEKIVCKHTSAFWTHLMKVHTKTYKNEIEPRREAQEKEQKEKGKALTSRALLKEEIRKQSSLSNFIVQKKSKILIQSLTKVYSTDQPIIQVKRKRVGPSSSKDWFQFVQGHRMLLKILPSFFALISFCSCQGSASITYNDVIVKEFHFHVYFFQTNEKSTNEARNLWDEIKRNIDNGYFKVRLLNLNRTPVGPHPIGSYEMWCPVEYFAKAYSFMVINRGSLSILIHPLTDMEVDDHSQRAGWLGPPVNLDLSCLSAKLKTVPSQYHKMCLGYSAVTCTKPDGFGDN